MGFGCTSGVCPQNSYPQTTCVVNNPIGAVVAVAFSAISTVVGLVIGAIVVKEKKRKRIFKVILFFFFAVFAASSFRH
jgi:hypothetical protein